MNTAFDLNSTRIDSVPKVEERGKEPATSFFRANMILVIPNVVCTSSNASFVFFFPTVNVSIICQDVWMSGVYLS